jgi:hypothetical protein
MRLSDACSVSSGYTARARLDPVEQGGIPAIQLRDLPPNATVNPRTLTRTKLDDVQERHFVRPGDVLFRSRGERNTASAVGHDLTEPALAVLPLMILRPYPQIVSAEYLAWAINHPKTQRFFDTVARGTKMRMLTRASLEQLELDIPDLETQRTIVALDHLAEQERALTVHLAGLRKELTNRILGERAKSPAAAVQKETK